MSINIFNQIKEIIDIVDYCRSSGINLTQCGNVYKGFSPFRIEWDPSFTVYPETQSWVDFGLAEKPNGGDIITLVARRNNISNTEACHQLAKEAGIAVPNLSPDDIVEQERWHKERDLCERILTDAADYYHNLILAGPWAYLSDKYYVKEKGFNKETIGKFKLGFSDGKLYDYMRWSYSDKDLLKSGLFYSYNGQLRDYFVGRYIYPYWYRGRVVYFIARGEEGLTPRNIYEYHHKTNKQTGEIEYGGLIKFKKLRTHAQYISPTIHNDWFYGEDTIAKSKTIVITEGVADCISAIQCGWDCISPVTTAFKKSDIDKLVRKCKGAEKVIICNDTEENDSGKKGAKATAIALAKAGIEVNIATLVNWFGIGKIDINDYTRIYGKQALDKVFEESINIIDFLVNDIPKDTKKEKLYDSLSDVLDLTLTYDPIKTEGALNKIKEAFKLPLNTLKKSLVVRKRQTEPAWMRTMELALTNEGKVKDTDANIIQILQLHPDLAGVFGFNDRKVVSMIMKDCILTTPGEAPCEVTNDHILRLITWMQKEVGLETNRTSRVQETLTAISQNKNISRVYDPIVDYLEQLPAWDGTKRMESIFIDYFGVQDNQLHREYGRCFLKSAIARAFIPGCKVDTLPVLIGEQGIGKSTFFQALVPDNKYFLDNLPNMLDKDGKMSLHGPWIVEHSELSSIRRMDINAIKNQLSIQVDYFRPPYGRNIEEHPRRCIFVGTTNEGQILKDKTGNRRFWPMETSTYLEAATLVSNRDQIWAEALQSFRADPVWWLTQRYEKERVALEDNFVEEDIDKEIIEAYLIKPKEEIIALAGIHPDIDYAHMFDAEGQRAYTTLLELSKITSINFKYANNISAILQNLGWARTSIKNTARKTMQRIYYDKNKHDKNSIKKVINNFKSDKISDLAN